MFRMPAKRMRTRSTARNKILRWNKAKRRIPSPTGLNTKWITTVLNNAAIAGGAMQFQSLTTIPVGTTLVTRTRAIVNIKGFRLALTMRPGSPNTMPTFMRAALIVQKGGFGNPGAGTGFEMLQGPTILDNAIDLGIAQPGFTLRDQPINKNQYDVIWARTVNIGPLLEAAATSIQSNLNAQTEINTYIKYGKNIQFDDPSDTNPNGQAVWLVYWFDDVFRAAAAASTTTHAIVGNIKTYFKEN